MTLKERRNPAVLNARRRIRVAKGSGVTVTELNTMMNKFGQMQQMMKKMGKFAEDDGQNGRAACRGCLGEGKKGILWPN